MRRQKTLKNQERNKRQESPTFVNALIKILQMKT